MNLCESCVLQNLGRGGLWLACKVARPGRSFLRRAISLLSVAKRYSYAQTQCSVLLDLYLKLKRPISRANSIRHFFFKRLPRLWNSLPTIDLSWSTTTIKHKLSQYFWNHFTVHFNPDNPCTYHHLCPCSRCAFHLFLKFCTVTTYLWLLV